MGLCTPRCKAITKNSVSRFDSPSLRCKDRIRAVVGAKSDFHSAQRKVCRKTVGPAYPSTFSLSLHVLTFMIPYRMSCESREICP